ncbi:hypothetical protein ABKN59_009996 [Abortiporus biennis]
MAAETDASREDMPRISVDSVVDWQRIKRSYTITALAEFEDRVAMSGKSEKEKDVLRGYFMKMIDKTFEMCKPNLRVNGKNFEDLNEDEEGVEPFDESFDRHIWALSDQKLSLEGEVAKKRREEPANIANLMQGLLEKQRVVDDKEAEVERKRTEDEDVVGDDQGDSVSDSVYENAESVLRKTFTITEELQQSITTQQERTERLTTVAEEIRKLKP